MCYFCCYCCVAQGNKNVFSPRKCLHAGKVFFWRASGQENKLVALEILQYFGLRSIYFVVVMNCASLVSWHCYIAVTMINVTVTRYKSMLLLNDNKSSSIFAHNRGHHTADLQNGRSTRQLKHETCVIHPDPFTKLLTLGLGISLKLPWYR